MGTIDWKLSSDNCKNSGPIIDQVEEGVHNSEDRNLDWMPDY